MYSGLFDSTQKQEMISAQNKVIRICNPMKLNYTANMLHYLIRIPKTNYISTNFKVTANLFEAPLHFSCAASSIKWWRLLAYAVQCHLRLLHANSPHLGSLPVWICSLDLATHSHQRYRSFDRAKCHFRCHMIEQLVGLWNDISIEAIQFKYPLGIFQYSHFYIGRRT